MTTPIKRKGAGLPPAGLNGERTSEYPPLTVRVPPRTKALLAALGQFHGVPAREIVTLGVSLALQALPPPEIRRVLQWAQTIEQTGSGE